MRQQFDNISWSCHKQRSQAGMVVEDLKMLPLKFSIWNFSDSRLKPIPKPQKKKIPKEIYFALCL